MVTDSATGGGALNVVGAGAGVGVGAGMSLDVQVKTQNGMK
jgi:hypothetical protein